MKLKKQKTERTTGRPHFFYLSCRDIKMCASPYSSRRGSRFSSYLCFYKKAPFRNFEVSQREWNHTTSLHSVATCTKERVQYGRGGMVVTKVYFPYIHPRWLKLKRNGIYVIPCPCNSGAGFFRWGPMIT